jgi:molybdate transport system ATP-binding protein
MSQTGLDVRLRLRRSDAFLLDLAFSIPPRKTSALLGPNGAGKSTVVAAVAGLLPIDDGQISLSGRVLDNPSADLFIPPEERRIGVVFQDYLLFPHLTVADNVAFGPRARGARRSASSGPVETWLERVGLSGLGGRKPAQLSGGQSQRVALARAMINEPDLLLLDEPLSALDVTTRAKLRRDLAAHLDQFPGPRLLITHDPTEAFLLADEIHIIENGSITQSGTPDDIRLRPRTRYAADLAGSNLVMGRARDGHVDTGTHILQIADRELAGPVMATISPKAISIYRQRPEGSPRNTWQAQIELIEHMDDRVRVRVGAPLALTIEITQGAAQDLELAPGVRIWLSIKATEILTREDS